MPSPTQWQPAQIGLGQTRIGESEVVLSLPAADSTAYHDAQITDYAMRHPTFENCPPLRLGLRARASGEIRGTAGFGFWNQLFVPGSRRLRPPQAIWFFFGSPPNNIALAHSVAGSGWKAATINARRWQF